MSWRAFSILNEVSNQTGLPITKTFNMPTTFPASQLLMVAGSAWSRETDIQLAVEVMLESEVVGTLFQFYNTPFVHRAFAPLMIPLSLPAGQEGVTLTLRDLDGSPTLTDGGDWFSVALIA